MKKILLLALPILSMILILLFPAQSFDGALSGLNLWMFVIIPTVFPFLIITEILKEINGFQIISYFPSKILSPLLHISSSASYAIITGLLCGYPLGAKAVSDLYEKRCISKAEAQYLLSFVNNPSPVFIVIFIFAKSVYADTYKLSLIFSLYLSIAITAIIFRNFFHFNTITSNTSPNNDFDNTSIFDDSIYKCFKILAGIGGYIIIFSILSSIIKYLLFTNNTCLSFIIGNLEITNGIHDIPRYCDSLILMSLAMCKLASLGGVSTFMQTRSVICKCGLSMYSYILGKIVSTTIMIIIFILIEHRILL